jgi:hypothetical protein
MHIPDLSMRKLVPGGAIAAAMLLIVFAASSANAACPAIPKMPQMPQGASASDDEMKDGRVKLQKYVDILQTFQKCREDLIKNAPPDTKPELKQQWQAEADIAVDNAHEIADIYSIQLRAFKARQ